MLRLARTVHHTSHDRHLELLDSRIALPPLRHLLTDVALDVLGHVLEERRCRASASWARRDLRREAAEPERLENLLSDEHFFGAVAIRLRRQRHADRVPDPLGQKNR